MLFMSALESDQFVTWDDEAIAPLFHQYLHMDESERFELFKLLVATAKYNRPESYLIAQSVLVLISEGTEAMRGFITAEAVAAGIPIP